MSPVRPLCPQEQTSLSSTCEDGTNYGYAEGFFSSVLVPDSASLNHKPTPNDPYGQQNRLMCEDVTC